MFRRQLSRNNLLVNKLIKCEISIYLYFHLCMCVGVRCDVGWCVPCKQAFSFLTSHHAHDTTCRLHIYVKRKQKHKYIKSSFEHEQDPVTTALQPQSSVKGIRTPPISHFDGQLRQEAVVVVVVMRGTRKQSTHDYYRNSKRLHSCIAAS